MTIEEIIWIFNSINILCHGNDEGTIHLCPLLEVTIIPTIVNSG